MMLVIWLVEAMWQTVAATPTVQKERVHITLHLKAEKKEGTGMGAQLFSCLDQLVQTVSKPRESITPSRDKKGCSIDEVMA